MIKRSDRYPKRYSSVLTVRSPTWSLPPVKCRRASEISYAFETYAAQQLEQVFAGNDRGRTVMPSDENYFGERGRNGDESLAVSDGTESRQSAYLEERH